MKPLLIAFGVVLALWSCIGHASPVASEQITLASPTDYQIIQRQSRDAGKLTVSGTLPTAADKIEARLTGKSASGELSGAWLVLTAGEHQNFRGELSVAAGGWYQLEVRAWRRGAVVATATVAHVGVGEIFVIAGQSNSANYGEERQTNHTGLVAAFDGAAWRLAGDPEPGAGGKGGSFMPVFGDALAEKFHVPIGIVAQGIGSTSVREWLPPEIVFANLPTITRNVVTAGAGQWHSSGKIFARFAAQLKQLGPHGFRAVLWHQGESDANQAGVGRTLPAALYRQYMETLICDVDREIGWEAPWFVAQASYHGPGDAGSPDIRAAQKALWDEGVALEGPDTDTLTGRMREKNGRGVHMSAEGLRAHGKLWAQKVAPWLELQTSKTKQ